MENDEQAWYRGEKVALKRLRIFTSDPESPRNHLWQLCREAVVWRGLHHPFILPFLGIDRETFSNAFCLVSPWMKHGTVLNYLRDNGRKDVDRLLLETAQGLEYLHSMNIVHGDLRGTNILISDDFHACISDFGLAVSLSDADTTIGSSNSSRAGSVGWFAPELIDPTTFGCDRFPRAPASDVYAFACVCQELYTGAPPFPGMSDVAAMLKFVAGERPKRPNSMSDELWTLVTSAWAQDFRARPAISEIIRTFPMLPTGDFP
ncbi:kinase-like domain-containing protein [Mycena epipterygia]|nr:kinase-like domain-containing protein [Mycena epipterygia]